MNLYLGKVVSRKEYDVSKKFTPQATIPKIKGYQTGLPIKQLGIIYVLDNRMRDNDTGNLLSKVPCKDYVDLFNENSKQEFLNVIFEEITVENLGNKEFVEPLFILHDVGGNEFQKEIEPKKEEEEGVTNTKLLFLGEQGMDDPKREIYRLYKHLPKQSINVNLNEPFNKKNEARYGDNWKEYFDYGIFSIKDKKQDKKWINKLKVCLNDLYLKTFVLKQFPVKDNAFPLLSERTYQQAGRLREYVWQFGKVLLCVENEKFHFLNLEKREGKTKRIELFEKLNIDWNSVNERFKSKNYIVNEDEYYESKIAKTHFIFAPNMCVQIEEPEERVLFNFGKGINRNIETTKGLSGIWFHQNSDERMYCVGSKDAVNFKTEKSVKIRRFNIHQGAENFKHEEILETLSVPFVRNEQYTVYPLFFDLIRLYKESI